MASLGTKNIKDAYHSPYSPNDGNLRPFELTKEGTKGVFSTGWQGCRVSFHDNYDQARLNAATKGLPTAVEGFFYKPYAHSQYQRPGHLVKVFTEIEIRTKCDEGLVISPADPEVGRDCLYIKPGEWWSDPVRLTLLTIFLRASVHPNLENMIQAGIYLTDTQKFVQHFLNGNTFWQGEKYSGWHKEFTTFASRKPEDWLKNTPSSHEEIEVNHHRGWPTRKWRTARK